MTKPILNLGDFTVCFSAEPEYESAREHFIDFCGWTEKQFKPIEDFPFFCAKVSIWFDGEEISSDYLGAYSYKTESEFYTRYRSDYFADMVGQCVDEADNPALTAAYALWAELMQKEHVRKSEIAKRAWEKREAKKAASAAA